MLDQVRARFDVTDGLAARSWLHVWFALAVVATVVLTLVPVTPSSGVYHNGDGGSTQPGYWMVGRDGSVYTFGLSAHFGDIPSATDAPAPSPVVSMSVEPNGRGYVLLSSDGSLSAFGSMSVLGSIGTELLPGETAASVSVTPTGQGYWIFTDQGRVFAFGDAQHRGDLAAFDLAGPIVSSVPTPSGDGYFMLGSDGGVFAFGDADFFGSVPQILPGVVLDCPVVGLVPTPSGLGYWLVGCDGGVFAFGDAGFVGSIPAVLPGVTLDQPINGMVAYGDGYLMVAFDGGVFNFATNLDFLGSLGGEVLPAPIVGVVPLG